MGRTENPIDGDITVDSGNADDKPVLLKGKITGKVNVVGTGTLESEINCSGFNGETKSTIHITGGEIIGTVNADNANESVITLTSADLIVDGNAAYCRSVRLFFAKPICDQCNWWSISNNE